MHDLYFNLMVQAGMPINQHQPFFTSLASWPVASLLCQHQRNLCTHAPMNQLHKREHLQLLVAWPITTAMHTHSAWVPIQAPKPGNFTGTRASSLQPPRTFQQDQHASLQQHTHWKDCDADRIPTHCTFPQQMASRPAITTPNLGWERCLCGSHATTGTPRVARKTKQNKTKHRTFSAHRLRGTLCDPGQNRHTHP